MLIPAVDEARILALRSLTEVKTPRRMAARSMTEKRISTMLSQEALVGDEVGVDAGLSSSQPRTSGSCGWLTVHHQVQLVVGVGARPGAGKRAARCDGDGA